MYCKNFHLCRIDSGIIEKNKDLRFSGYLKRIDCDSSASAVEVPVKNCGPIHAWWTTGFDKEFDNDPTIVITTEFGDYALMKPSENYSPFMQPVLSKMFVTKILIEYLTYNPNATFEEILFKVEVKHIHSYIFVYASLFYKYK